jgi:hypothetical protein
VELCRPRAGRPPSAQPVDEAAGPTKRRTHTDEHTPPPPRPPLFPDCTHSSTGTSLGSRGGARDRWATHTSQTRPKAIVHFWRRAEDWTFPPVHATNTIHTLPPLPLPLCTYRNMRRFGDTVFSKPVPPPPWRELDTHRPHPNHPAPTPTLHIHTVICDASETRRHGFLEIGPPPPGAS